MSHSLTPAPALAKTGLLLAIAYLGFISLGLPDTLIGVAWPAVRDDFGRAQGAMGWISFGAGLAYFCSSLLAGRMLNAWGVGWLLAGSSALVAAAMLGFGSAPWWLLFVLCAPLHGLGSGAIDSGLNHYVAHHFSARHMNWLHACYSLGATIGPIIMTATLTHAHSWRLGYWVVAGTLATLAILFVATHRLWDAQPAAADEEGAGKSNLPASAALRQGAVWVHVALFFIYTGLEVTVGQWSFTVLKEGRGVGQETAGMLVTLYWGSIGVGRVLFGFVVERWGIDRLLRLSMAMAVLGAVLFWFSHGALLSGVALGLVGLGLASIFPCLMTRTPQRFGTGIAAHAIGFQVSAAMIGVAVLPGSAGFLAQKLGLWVVPIAATAMAAALLTLHEALLRRDRSTSAA